MDEFERRMQFSSFVTTNLGTQYPLEEVLGIKPEEK
ncbi:MAG: hypothetical protein DDT24_00072 [Chloroflexi bacterium]|nr:hypothetical protein [Chloroflexota bacterium]MBT9165829.1 hypothetical protein [Chloroflexota bacterium]